MWSYSSIAMLSRNQVHLYQFTEIAKIVNHCNNFSNLFFSLVCWLSSRWSISQFGSKRLVIRIWDFSPQCLTSETGVGVSHTMSLFDLGASVQCNQVVFSVHAVSSLFCLGLGLRAASSSFFAVAPSCPWTESQWDPVISPLVLEHQHNFVPKFCFQGVEYCFLLLTHHGTPNYSSAPSQCKDSLANGTLTLWLRILFIFFLFPVGGTPI